MERLFDKPPRSDLQMTAAGAKHLEREVSSFERMLEGITRVLAPGES